MAKKRKSDASRLDEVDRSMYSTFCTAANSLSQIYTQAMSQKKLAFQAGERHALEKLVLWIMRQHEEGSRVTASDIFGHLQNEIDYGGDDTSSHKPQRLDQHPESIFPLPTSTIQNPGFLASSATRFHPSDQSKNSVFSDALSSPTHRTLRPYLIPQEEANCHDSSMEMHTDSPVHDSYG
ncbi:hypothetical protein AXF42_Ash007250 [Apostasia shenzhenica]|uniref:Holocarboxylase synthetase n=1 Tax=Apostasia shenzhenica TaxID=1088818 RepID=A0A2I0B9M4_9ASPA|nr:hypothetical protein AXF42_Ash007250 [Apostasia shenzhenica]